MRDLVKLAEERELRAKAALAQLLVSRSTALEEQGATITGASPLHSPCHGVCSGCSMFLEPLV